MKPVESNHFKTAVNATRDDSNVMRGGAFVQEGGGRSCRKCLTINRK